MINKISTIKLLHFTFGLFCSFQGKGQSSNGYWLPLKRLESIRTLKEDVCDSINLFPFQKIKIYSNNKVSLFGYMAADPTVCKMEPLSKNSWIVKQTYLYTLDIEPALIKNSVVTLKIQNDTLIVTLVNGNKSIVQQFVRKFGNVFLKDYREVEVGNILITGKYLDVDLDTIVFSETGSIEQHPNDLTEWDFIKYRFISYSLNGCYEPDSEKVVELTAKDGQMTKFNVKSSLKGLEFYGTHHIHGFWRCIFQHNFMARIN